MMAIVRLLGFMLTIALLVSAGRHWEKSRTAELTKVELRVVSLIELLFGIYFLIATIGAYAT